MDVLGDIDIALQQNQPEIGQAIHNQLLSRASDLLGRYNPLGLTESDRDSSQQVQCRRYPVEEMRAEFPTICRAA